MIFPLMALATMTAISVAATGSTGTGPAPGASEDWYDPTSPVAIDSWLVGDYPPESRMVADGLEAWCAERRESVAAHESRTRPAQVTLNNYVFCAEIRRDPPPNTPIAGGKGAFESLWIEWWVRTTVAGESVKWKRLAVRRYENSLVSGSMVALALDPGPLADWVDASGASEDEHHKLAIVLSMSEGGERVLLHDYYLEGAVPKAVKLTDKDMKGATAKSASTSAFESGPRWSIGVGAVAGGPDRLAPPIAPKLGIGYRIGSVTTAAWFSGGVGDLDIDGETFVQTFLSGALMADVPVVKLGRQVGIGPTATVGYVFRDASRDGESLTGHAPYFGGGLRGRWLPSRRFGLIVDPAVTAVPLLDESWSAAWSVGIAGELLFGRWGE